MLPATHREQADDRQAVQRKDSRRHNNNTKQKKKNPRQHCRGSTQYGSQLRFHIAQHIKINTTINLRQQKTLGNTAEGGVVTGSALTTTIKIAYYKFKSTKKRRSVTVNKSPHSKSEERMDVQFVLRVDSLWPSSCSNQQHRARCLRARLPPNNFLILRKANYWQIFAWEFLPVRRSFAQCLLAFKQADCRLSHQDLAVAPALAMVVRWLQMVVVLRRTIISKSFL